MLNQLCYQVRQKSMAEWGSQRQTEGASLWVPQPLPTSLSVHLNLDSIVFAFTLHMLSWVGINFSKTNLERHAMKWIFSERVVSIFQYFPYLISAPPPILMLVSDPNFKHRFGLRHILTHLAPGQNLSDWAEYFLNVEVNGLYLHIKFDWTDILFESNRSQLLSQQEEAQIEKRKLARLLRQFEDDFLQQHGRSEEFFSSSQLFHIPAVYIRLCITMNSMVFKDGLGACVKYDVWLSSSECLKYSFETHPSVSVLYCNELSVQFNILSELANK